MIPRPSSLRALAKAYKIFEMGYGLSDSEPFLRHRKSSHESQTMSQLILDATL